MRYSDAPEDFGDPFEAPRAVATIVLDGHTLVMLLSIVGVALVLFTLSWWAADQISKAGLRARHKASARAIYDSIRFSLHQAVSASGALQLERARELSAVIEARLGSLLVLKDKTGKLFEDLGKALKEPEPDPEAPKKETPAKVKVDMTSDEHRVAVWRALQAFHEVWKDEAHILNLLEGAQAELGHKAVGHDFYRAFGVNDPRYPWGGAPGSRSASRSGRPVREHDADSIVAPVIVAPEASEPPTPPVPTPPAPAIGPDDLPPPAPRPKKGKLAKHKRNMLA